MGNETVCSCTCAPATKVTAKAETTPTQPKTFKTNGEIYEYLLTDRLPKAGYFDKDIHTNMQILKDLEAYKSRTSEEKGHGAIRNFVNYMIRDDNDFNLD